VSCGWSHLPNAALKPSATWLILKCYLMVRALEGGYFCYGRPTALAPESGGHMAAERTAHATPPAWVRLAARSGLLRTKPMAVAGR
jgi:hypothetical protein